MTGFQVYEGRERSGISAAAVNRYRRVVPNSAGKFLHAGAGDACVGFVTRAAAAADTPMTLVHANAVGTVNVEITAAIARNGICYAAADGKVAPTGTVVEGICLDVGPATAAAGDIIEMLPIKFLGNRSEQTKLRALRQRVTLTNVNAGLTLLAAIPGFKYRVHDVALIAIGGNAAGATTIDITGTQTSSVKLLAAAVAGLTQNTLLRAGATNAAILAGGVSFVANDVNTAIAIGKTGSDLSGATHIDVLLTYTIEE